jgi:hypothetical protein
MLGKLLDGKPLRSITNRLERGDQCVVRFDGSLYRNIIGLADGALFQRKPIVALTVLGDAVHPYFDRIAENAAHAREAAQAMADVRRSLSMPLQRLVSVAHDETAVDVDGGSVM